MTYTVYWLLVQLAVLVQAMQCVSYIVQWSLDMSRFDVSSSCDGYLAMS